MAQLMPLPLTVSCFSEIQIGFTFLVPAHLGSPGQRAVKWGVCVCVFVVSDSHWKPALFRTGGFLLVAVIIQQVAVACAVTVVDVYTDPPVAVCSTAVLCWYDSHHFWINTNTLKCIPRLYATAMHQLHSYNVLVVSQCLVHRINDQAYKRYTNHNQTLFTLIFRSLSETFVRRSCSILLLVLAAVVMWRGKKLVVRVAQCIAALVPVNGTPSLLSDVHCFLNRLVSDSISSWLLGCHGLHELSKLTYSVMTNWTDTDFLWMDKQKKEEVTDCVYKIAYSNCEMTYIGETGRKFGTRLKEHKTEAEATTSKPT